MRLSWFIPPKTGGDLFKMEHETDYQSLFCYRNLYLSYLKARRGKRWSDEVVSYSLNLERNLHLLERQRRKKEYHFGGYYSFPVHEPKERRIQAIHFQDRVLQHCLCDFYLIPLLERHLIYDNAATRVGKGTDFARKRRKRFRSRLFLETCSNDGYVLKFDIHHYFPSISHVCLKEKLSRIILDKDIRDYVSFLIDTYHEEGHPDRGLPIGNQLSQCCGLLYLDKVDRIIKEQYRFPFYSRYRDDGIVISENKGKLKECLSLVKEQLCKDRLLLNPKTRIFSLSEGFEYLGFRYFRKEGGRIIQVLKKKKKERILRFIKRKIGTEGSYDPLFYEDYLKRGDNYSFLKKIKGICSSGKRETDTLKPKAEESE